MVLVEELLLQLMAVILFYWLHLLGQVQATLLLWVVDMVVEEVHNILEILAVLVVELVVLEQVPMLVHQGHQAKEMLEEMILYNLDMALLVGVGAQVLLV
jgi:hypothetical protein